MSEHIILISENNVQAKEYLAQIKALRRCNFLQTVSIQDLKQTSFDNLNIIFINEDEYNNEELSKTIKLIRRKNSYSKVIILTSKNVPENLAGIFSLGIYDFISKSSVIDEAEIKILNCLKYISLQKNNNILSIFIDITNCRNSKTGLYTHKALKEAFYYLTEHKEFKNAAYIILALDEESKTKFSMNQLGLSLKTCLRNTDIIAQGSGKFYLILPDTDYEGAKVVLNKISNIMGNDIKIHSGIAKIGINRLEDIEKRANDSLKSAIINDELYTSLEKNNYLNENWDNNDRKDKHFKLFYKTYNKKLNDLIQPLFFRYEKQFESMLDNTNINQYANETECVFSLKDPKHHSELIMKYDGFAKINTQIIHKGLDTTENSEGIIPLNKFDEKLISKLLNKLYSEFSGDYTNA